PLSRAGVKLYKLFPSNGLLHYFSAGYLAYGNLISSAPGALRPAQSLKSLILSKVLASLADKKNEVRFIPLITIR
ncbi:MAG: hypothetical protein VX288_10060, partial [Planctomycetota bacterium]|nr:hypothetical protein [Planctomycetota bacterium]